MTVSLSIVIPTFNGAPHIRQALDSIVSQLEDINEEVEVVISDNASTDQIQEIIREYQANYPFIKYFRNEENVGPVKNLDMSVLRSNGKYAWFFGDDDRMKEGGILYLLKILNQYNYNLSFISVNADIYGSNWICKAKNPLGLTKDILFKSPNSLFETLKDQIGLTPTMVVNRELWLNEMNIRNETNNWCVHLKRVLEIATKRHSYFIAEPYVMFNHSNIRWLEKGLFLTIICDYCEVVKNLNEKYYTDKAKNEALSRWQGGLNYQIVDAKLKDWKFNSAIVKRLLKLFYKFPTFWLLDLPLLLLPAPIYKRKIAGRALCVFRCILYGNLKLLLTYCICLAIHTGNHKECGSLLTCWDGIHWSIVMQNNTKKEAKGK